MRRVLVWVVFPFIVVGVLYSFVVVGLKTGYRWGLDLMTGKKEV